MGHMPPGAGQALLLAWPVPPVPPAELVGQARLLLTIGRARQALRPAEDAYARASDTGWRR
jgi:hypothetical protein